MEAAGDGDFYAARDRNDAVQQARHNDGREDAERNNARWSVELVATVEEVMDDSITDTDPASFLPTGRFEFERVPEGPYTIRVVGNHLYLGGGTSGVVTRGSLKYHNLFVNTPDL